MIVVYKHIQIKMIMEFICLLNMKHKIENNNNRFNLLRCTNYKAVQLLKC